MKIRIRDGIKKFFACNVTEVDDPNPENLDIREEYANAFRTESYTEFWTNVLNLSKGNLTTHRSLGSTTAARLPSYRLFAEHLLDPDQTTVERILDSNQTHPKIFPLLCDYFTNTSDASYLCGLLLKDIDHIRKRYKSLKSSFIPSPMAACPNIPAILTRVTVFSKSNPFRPSAPSLIRFQVVQANCIDLLKGLEFRRDKTQTKLRRLKKLKCGSTIILVTLTVTLTVILAAHAFVMLVAAPGLMAASLKLPPLEKLARCSTQLDSAAKGTYILIRDLDTISRLVARLNNELEHIEASMQLWLERGDDRLQANGKLVCQLEKNDLSFLEQLDELEEHLYLCLMTINRARNLVVKEIIDSGINPTLNSSSLAI